MKLTMKWFKRRARLRAMLNRARGRYHAASPASHRPGRVAGVTLKDFVIHALEQAVARPKQEVAQSPRALLPRLLPGN
jgi:hypothetical protein